MAIHKRVGSRDFWQEMNQEGISDFLGFSFLLQKSKFCPTSFHRWSALFQQRLMLFAVDYLISLSLTSHWTVNGHGRWVYLRADQLIVGT